MKDLVNGVGVLRAAAEEIDSFGHVHDERAEPRLVVGSDHRSIGLALTL